MDNIFWLLLVLLILLRAAQVAWRFAAGKLLKPSAHGPAASAFALTGMLLMLGALAAIAIALLQGGGNRSAHLLAAALFAAPPWIIAELSLYFSQKAASRYAAKLAQENED